MSGFITTLRVAFSLPQTPPSLPRLSASSHATERTLHLALPPVWLGFVSGLAAGLPKGQFVARIPVLDQNG